MSLRMQLDDRQWAKVNAFLRQEAVLWIQRTGASWRDLPNEFGPWKTVFNRFDRWSKNGKWKRLLNALKTDVDDEWSSIDATIVRAHQHAAGAKGGLRDRRTADLAVAPPPRST